MHNLIFFELGGNWSDAAMEQKYISAYTFETESEEQSNTEEEPGVCTLAFHQRFHKTTTVSCGLLSSFIRLHECRRYACSPLWSWDSKMYM